MVGTSQSWGVGDRPILPPSPRTSPRGVPTGLPATPDPTDLHRVYGGYGFESTVGVITASGLRGDGGAGGPHRYPDRRDRLAWVT